MKTIVRISLIAPLLIMVLEGIAQDAPSPPDSLLQRLLQKHPIAGAAAAYAIQGETIWSNGVGYSHLEQETPFTPTTKTRIASLAKPMTAIAIMQLVEQGLLDLDAPLQTYIPDYPRQTDIPMTTRHLLAHTSGIAGYKNGKEAENKTEYPDLQAAMRVFQERELLFEPGTNFAYTSYGYVVLGVIIEQVSGMSYADYMQQNIWDKAQMDHTGIESYGVAYDQQSALYHASKGKIKLAKPNNLSNRTPGGGLYATVEDMIKFGNAVVNHTLIAESSLSAMNELQFRRAEGNSYGYGWFLYGPSPQEGAVIGHGGGQTGVSAQLLINPGRKLVVVVLANTSGTGNGVMTTAIELIKLGSK